MPNRQVYLLPKMVINLQQIRTARKSRIRMDLDMVILIKKEMYGFPQDLQDTVVLIGM
jgi:hypothetical protein